MKRLVLLIVLGGALAALLVVNVVQKNGDEKVALQVVGDVKDILSGNGGNGIGVSQLGLRYALGAIDVSADMSFMGEALIFDGQIWTRPSWDGGNLPSIRLNGKPVFSSFMVGFSEFKVIGLKNAHEAVQFGKFLDSFIDAQTEPHRLFGYYGTVEFSTLESSVLIKPAIHGEPITNELNREQYFRIEKDANQLKAQVFGMCLNQEIGERNDLESRIFYVNPAQKSNFKLETHSHALVTYGDKSVEVVHILQQSIVSNANVTIIAAY